MGATHGLAYEGLGEICSCIQHVSDTTSWGGGGLATHSSCLKVSPPYHYHSDKPEHKPLASFKFVVMRPDLALISFFLGLPETRIFRSFNYSYPTTPRRPTAEAADARKGVEPQNHVFVVEDHHRER
jgi:hypothetical protein